MRASLLLALAVIFGGCERVDYIELDPSDVELRVPDSSAWLEARCMARNGVRAVGARVTWSMRDPSIATVNDKGQVKPVADGDTEVIARFQGLEARAPVRVVYVDRVELAEPALTLQTGQEPVIPGVKLWRKNGQAITGRAVSLVSGDKAVVRVLGTGALAAVGPGQAEVEVRADGARATLRVNVSR